MIASMCMWRQPDRSRFLVGDVDTRDARYCQYCCPRQQDCLSDSETCVGPNFWRAMEIPAAERHLSSSGYFSFVSFGSSSYCLLASLVTTSALGPFIASMSSPPPASSASGKYYHASQCLTTVSWLSSMCLLHQKTRMVAI